MNIRHIGVCSERFLNARLKLYPLKQQYSLRGRPIRGYPFFYVYCAGMLKQNHWEQRPMCSVDKQVHRARRIITLQGVTWVTDGGMLYRITENELYN